MSKELELLRIELNKYHPELLQLEKNSLIPDPEPMFSELNLLFKDDERSCVVIRYGYEKKYRCIFEWDDCTIFEILSDDKKKLGEILLSWVYKKSVPSKMKIQFPEIAFGIVAEYYEKGEGVKGEFIESWNLMEKYYGDFSDSWSEKGQDALRLIKEMRKLGLDQELRAGQSLWFFILSRSRRHGLQKYTPYIEIAFIGNNQMAVKSYLNGKEKRKQCEVTYKEYLQKEVKELLAKKIQ